MELEYSLGLVLTLFGASTFGTPLCDETQRVQISSSNFSSPNGLTFTKGHYWHHQDGLTYGCPCLFKNCLRPCKGSSNEILTRNDTKTIVYTDAKGEGKNVLLRDQFYLFDPLDDYMNDAVICHQVSNFSRLLQNGSLIFLQDDEEDLSQEDILFTFDEFCVAIENTTILNIILCDPHELQEPEKQLSMLYPILGCISSFFLCLVIVFYILVPEMRTLQNRSVVFQSATLAIGLLSLSVLQMSTSIMDNAFACKFFAYGSQYFILSSFAWLTTMCFDMFWTFSGLKNMAVVSQSSGQFKFKLYGTLATLLPLLILILTMILDFTLSKEWNIWPGIGSVRCWFLSRHSEFWFFQGPLLLMLLTNFGFSIATLASICKMRRESKILNDSDSNATKTKENWINVLLTMKLFLLMGGTWLMEFVSWAIGNHGGIMWIIFDSVNLLRGPVIFYLCVIGNARVRKAIITRMQSRANLARCSQNTINSNFTNDSTLTTFSKCADTAL